MKVKIHYHSIGYGASMFATPEFTHSEIVEAENLEDLKLIKHIKSQKDDYGNYFKKKESLGFNYISHQGGVKVEEYIEPKIKKL